jgi:hypothetical protein
MCKETMDEGAATATGVDAQESPLTQGPSNEAKKNDSDRSTDDSATMPEATEAVTRDWCCREKKHVTCGADLGVMEQSLENQAGYYSTWMLSYLTPLLRLGSLKVLENSDVGVPSKEDLADKAYVVAWKAWEEQTAATKVKNEQLKRDYEKKVAKCSTEAKRSKVKPPIYKEPGIALALLIGFGRWRIAYAISIYIISTLLGFVPVLILTDLVQFFESGLSVNEYDGFPLPNPWANVAALGVIPFLISLLQTRHSVIMAHCAVFVRTAVSTMLYRKALRVSGAGRAMTSTGQVVNMMSNDTAQLQRFLQYGAMTLTAPITIIIALVLIYQQVRLRIVVLNCVMIERQGSVSPCCAVSLILTLMIFCFYLTGWTRHVGRSWIHGPFGSGQHGCLFDCLEAAS